MIDVQLALICVTLTHRCTNTDVEALPSLHVFLQVLQQECVDVESLDDVDSSGKTLLDRLTMPVIFPDGYTLTHFVTLGVILWGTSP